MLITKENQEALNKLINYHTKAAFDSFEFILSGELQRRQDELFNFESHVDNSKEKIHFIFEVAKHISNICLDHTPDVIEPLQTMGFTDKELSWVLPFKEQIEPEILKINKKKEYFVLKEDVIITLGYYLSTKIYIMVINHYRIKDKKGKVPLNFARVREGFINFKKKTDARKNAANPDKETSFDIAIVALKNVWDSILPHISDKLTMEKYIPSLSTRNFDKSLVSIFNNSITIIAEKSKNHKYRTFYPLFRLMMPHKRWAANEIDFSNNSSDGDGYNFEEYMTKKMQKFIGNGKQPN